MPTVEDNKSAWDGGYEWADQGDEWSFRWGGASMQWYGSILPRIHSFVPADTILEIACGYGRWTQFLKNSCNRLIALDLSEQCISACRERFGECTNVEYHLNDGKSLEMIADSSVDFVFSFDSLVHADGAVLKSYISQLNRILKDDGVAFIHHSNLGEYSEMYSNIRKIPKLGFILRKLGVLEKKLHWRDPEVSAEIVETLARDHELKCISQEIIPWGTKRAQIDCFSTLVKKTSLLARENQIYRNKNFMLEAEKLSQLSRLYSSNQKTGS